MTLHSLAATTDPNDSLERSWRTRIIGRGESHRKAMRDLASAAATDVEVLILGPSGVGKEMYARWIHENGARSRGAFVPVNCGAIPVALFENELFGHVGGAFTGARASSDGLVAGAEGGTLFLDEIDALDPSAQVKLLRFLQEREYRRLGESRIRKANVRILAASNADLVLRVREARFREDLMFRVRVFPLRIPPLCDRSEDIEPLLEAFIQRCADDLGTAPIRLSANTMRHLEAYSWPGNVRELENCVRFLTSLRLDRLVEPGDLTLLGDTRAPQGGAVTTRPAAVDTPQSLNDAKRELVSRFERGFVIDALRASRGNIAHAARASGKSRRVFFELMRKYSVSANDYC
ncbi:MAG TPA: sigma-54 dependent transcriptional regulator [Burkholderiaceae bacterium]|jgi:DNA-binding NtrC family response regulator|nr:sigma-54 dependent transcriptional regulator [Burkholderiaceae bacterium]